MTAALHPIGTRLERMCSARETIRLCQVRTQITVRVKQLASEIDDIARTARTIDPSNGFSYAAMCGGFGAVLIGLARDLAGEDAEQMVRKAIERAYASEQEGGAA